MTTFLLYCILMLDSFKSLLDGFGVIIFIGLAIYGVIIVLKSLSASMEIWDSEKEKEYREIKAFLNKSKGYLIKAFIAFCAISTLNSFIPSTKQMAVLYIVPEIANSEKIKNIGSNGLTILEKHVEEYMKNITSKAEDKK